jgi:DNA-binding MarR family transcriptional regulator
MAPIEHELRLLEEIAREPDTTQADLAAGLGLAVGSVNWYLKRLIKKGYIKVTRLQRRRLRYLITPQGMAEKARLTYQFMQASLHVYRQARQEAQRLLEAAQAAGYGAVRIEGDSDLAEICYLTCLEQGLQAERGRADVPTLRAESMRLVLTWPDGAVPLEVHISPWVRGQQ